MITELEQKELKILFQGHYTEEVLKILDQRNIVNRKGKPHSPQYVRMVFQGIRNNTDIESAIWYLAGLKKKELQFQKHQKNNILNRML